MTTKPIQHLHVLIKAKVANPQALDPRGLCKWMRGIVDEQGMKMVIAPRVFIVEEEGNEGPTGSCNLATSHFAIHVWDKKNMVQADLYTCGDLNVKKLINQFDVFSIVELEYLVLDRADGFKIIKSGKLSGRNSITRGE